MGVKVLTAATSHDLVTLDTVKDRLGLSADYEQDARLEDLIAEASSAIAEYLGRPIARQRYLETLSGNARERLALARFPVDRDSVTLTIDDTAETDFTVEDPSQGLLWREGAWPHGEGVGVYAERPEENVAVTYKAGYVLPGLIDAWANSATLTVGRWVRPTSAVGDLLMEVTTGGVAGASEPTWPTTAGSTVTSSAAILTARNALELPRVIQSAAWLVVHELYTSMTRGLGVRAVESDGQRVEYQSDANQRGGLPVGVMRMLDGWRIAA